VPRFKLKSCRLRAASAGLALTLLVLASARYADAQPPGRGGFGAGRAGGPPPSAEESAPVDLTGTWVSLVTEDWIERMSPDSPASGSGGGAFGFGRGRGGAGAAAPAITSDDPCAAYGAGGIMRVPGRLKLSWQDENTLLLEYDAGSQRRIIHFDNDEAPVAAGPSLQGSSTASWEGGGGGRRSRGGPQRGFGAPADARAAAAPMPWQSLEIVTTNLSPGYLLSSRSWYGGGARLTELLRYHNDFGREYFTVTAVIEEIGQTTSTTSSTFKKEPDDSKFEPTGCEIKPRRP
jgi:hypothetical protein